jgi:hypothetical protein
MHEKVDFGVLTRTLEDTIRKTVLLFEFFLSCFWGLLTISVESPFCICLKFCSGFSLKKSFFSGFVSFGETLGYFVGFVMRSKPVLGGGVLFVSFHPFVHK